MEPLGIRIFGIEFRETHLEAISKTLVETIYAPTEIIQKIADGALKFGDLILEDESYAMKSNPEILQSLFSRSGLSEHKPFFESFLENLGRRKGLINMLAGLSSVTAESGSIRVKFRNRSRKIEELKINLKKIWVEIRKREKEIKNSFNHLAEFARRAVDEIEGTIVHIGLYGAAFVLVILSLWYSVAYSVTSGLSTIASNAVTSLKATFPILSMIIWLFCLIFEAVDGRSKINEAYDAIKQLLASNP